MALFELYHFISVILEREFVQLISIWCPDGCMMSGKGRLGLAWGMVLFITWISIQGVPMLPYLFFSHSLVGCQSEVNFGYAREKTSGCLWQPSSSLRFFDSQLTGQYGWGTFGSCSARLLFTLTVYIMSFIVISSAHLTSLVY